MSETISDSTVPRLVEGLNLAALSLTPKEGFFITRIDGMTGFSDLCSITGLSPDSAREVLNKLRKDGAVCWEGVEAPTAPKSKSKTAAALNPELMNEPVDLEVVFKEQVILKHAEMAGQNHYQVLEIKRRATVKEIKRAYRKLAAIYHPDRFFRQELGSFKDLLEAICLRLRKAHTVLTDNKKRRLYDDKLFVAPRLKKRKTVRGSVKDRGKLAAHPVMQKVKKGREYFNAAVAAKKKGDILQADASLKLAIACDPKRQEYKDLAKALEVEINREKAKAVFHRARDAKMMDNVGEALQGFRRAMEMDPDESDYLVAFAEYSAEHGGDPEEAATMARRAVFRSGGLPVIRQTYAQLLERAERFDEAITEYRKLTDFSETAAFAM